jgi:hypothetical protein
MSNIYLQVNYSDGAVYQYSKDAKEGFESHKNTKGVESFRRFLKKGLYGTLLGVTVRESDFGKEVSVAVKDKDGNSNYLNLPLFDAKKNLASYAESFIAVLPSLKVGVDYRIYPYNIKEEGQKYSKTGVSVVLANVQEETVDKENTLKRLSYTYTKEGVEVKGDIPAILWEEDFDGSRTMNSKAKNKYLYDVLMANLTEGRTSAPPKEAPKATPAQVFKPTQIPPPQERDELPF